MKSLLQLTIFLVILTITSCQYRDYTSVKKDICSVHKRKLKKTLVPLGYGYPFDHTCSDFPYARRSVSMGCERPRRIPLIRVARIYTCRKCTVGCRRKVRS